MNITSSLDLKSLGIFGGIACALQEVTPPCVASTHTGPCGHVLPTYMLVFLLLFFQTELLYGFYFFNFGLIMDAAALIILYLG